MMNILFTFVFDLKIIKNHFLQNPETPELCILLRYVSLSKFLMSGKPYTEGGTVIFRRRRITKGE